MVIEIPINRKSVTVTVIVCVLLVWYLWHSWHFRPVEPLKPPCQEECFKGRGMPGIAGK